MRYGNIGMATCIVKVLGTVVMSKLFIHYAAVMSIVLCVSFVPTYCYSSTIDATV